MPLEPKQELFVLEYMKDLNQTQAYIRAGYSEKGAKQNASRLMTNDDVQEAIQAKMRERSQKCQIDAEWVVSHLVRNVEMAMKEVPVLNSEGKPVGVYQYQGAVANKGLELLGKNLGMFADKHEHSGPDGGPMQLEAKHEHSGDINARIAQLSGAFREAADRTLAERGVHKNGSS